MLISLCLFLTPGSISFSSMLSSTRPGRCWVLAASLCLFHPSTRNHFFLLQSALNRVRIIFWTICLYLIVPATRKHLFLQSAFYRTKILLVFSSLPLPIPSTRNHLFLLYGFFNKARPTLSFFGLQVGFPLRSTWTEVLTLPLCVTTINQVVSSFSAFITGSFCVLILMMIFNNTCNSLWLCHFCR